MQRNIALSSSLSGQLAVQTQQRNCNALRALRAPHVVMVVMLPTMSAIDRIYCHRHANHRHHEHHEHQHHEHQHPEHHEHQHHR